MRALYFPGAEGFNLGTFQEVHSRILHCTVINASIQFNSNIFRNEGLMLALM